MKWLCPYLIPVTVVMLGSLLAFSTHYDNQKNQELQQDFYSTARKITKINDGICMINDAARTGNNDLIDFLVENGVALDTGRSSKRWTPLCLAAMNGHSNVVIKFISLGLNPQEKSYDDHTALEVSRGAARKILSTYDPYLEAKDAPTEEPVPHQLIRLKLNKVLSHICAHESLQNSFQSLINQLDPAGQTPLDIAVVTRNEEAVRLLLSYGADTMRGLYGLRLVGRIPEWLLPGGPPGAPQPSLYQHFYKTSLIAILTPLPRFATIPHEIIIRIIEFALDFPF